MLSKYRSSLRRVAVMATMCIPLVLSMAGCPSAPTGGTAASRAPDCGAAGPVAFTHATFRAPGAALRALDAAGCMALPSGGGSPSETIRRAVASTTAPAPTDPAGDDDPPMGTVPPPPPLDWNYVTPAPAGPVTGTPALYIHDFAAQDNVSDKLFYGTNTTRGPNFFALSSLYSAAPSVLWSQTNYGTDGSGVALDSSFSRVYQVDSQGSLNCYDAATGNNCAGWSTRGYTTGNGASLSSPWVDGITSAVYFGDLAGVLYKVNGLTGALVWSVDLNTKMTAPCATGACSLFGVRSSPVQIDDTIFVGNDAGAFFRIVDPGATAPTTVDATWLCTSPFVPTACGSAWSMLNGATIDSMTGTLYVAAAGFVIEYPLAKASSWAQLNRVDIGSAAGYPVYSSPIIEYNNTYVYVGYDNRLFKIKYPFNGATTSVSAPLAGAGPDASYPHSSPLPYSGSIFIGDGSGSAERFGCMSAATSPSLTAMTISYGTSVDSVPVIDYGTGNINFGYTNGTGGGVVQIGQNQSWGCGVGSTCATAGCGGTAPACISVALRQCCTLADCGTAVANSTLACTAYNCVTTCTSGYKACGNSCISNATCCTNADCSGATPVCSGVGGSCVAGQVVSFTFHAPPASGTQSVVATIDTPVTTLTATGVTFTNGSAVINGVGTVFASSFKVGQQISADGTTFYTVSVINSSTKITLTSAYLQSTRTVATYYEADCVAGQTCPSTASFTIACTSPTCTLSTALPKGDYAIAAKAYDGPAGTRRVQGAYVKSARFRLTGGANDLASAHLVLPRIYPVGTNATDARCPLDIAIDASGNVWTVNGNGNSGSSCTGPTNNLSKLVKGAGTYNPTVVNNPVISASPEFIDADTSGNVWVTVPSLASGILRLNSAGALTAGFPVGTGQCQTPRGIAVDKSATGLGAAYVACFGTTTFPGANGRRVQKWTTAGAVAGTYDFTDTASQPVSLVIPFAAGQTNDEDYNCRRNVYVNRSSTTSVVISRLSLDFADPIASYTLAGDLNPYGLGFDGAGTPYAVARSTGNILNVEYDGTTTLALDSNNSARAAPTPWAVAGDDQYPVTGTYCRSPSGSDTWATHSATDYITRFNNNPQTIKNDYIVGSTADPQPRGIRFDASTGYLWVVNSSEATLSRISKRLSLLAADIPFGTPSACPTSVSPGGTLVISGKGFDATPTNNTVLVAGYVATPTAVTINATGTLDTISVKVPTDVAGTVRQITVINSDGAVRSNCSYTAL